MCAASYGCCVASLLVARRRVQRALFRAPALYPDAWLDVPLRERGPLGDTHRPNRTLSSLASLEGPLLVLESGRDEVIPHAMIEAYLGAVPGARHELIRDATHDLAEPAWEDEYRRLIVEWFRPLAAAET